ncbi:GTPase [uncultured Vibrio sp.]|uniref:YcjF family protein n=1 Tax=uncultured Vibrio sp. TaxID=114054 RepID=UPI0025DB6560|nr:GTPase [uncultured Vibrio sp.]
MYESIKAFINPKQNADLTLSEDVQKVNLPTLWLLGKTGAGKSSLIQALTGRSSIEIGNGFQPCTKTAATYDFPADKPILRFLDTRGLAEAGYDPSDDIEQFILGQSSDTSPVQVGQALVVVIKLDDPEQSALLSVLKQIKSSGKVRHVIAVVTAVKQASTDERKRLISYHESQLNMALGSKVNVVDVDFAMADGTAYNVKGLIEALSAHLPIIHLMTLNKEHVSIEERNFKTLENEVLWYSGSASASDLIPAVGLVSVPAIQAKMLHSLAQQYGIDWDKRVFAEFIGTLGGSFGLQYGLKLGARQLTKLIPGYGQTVGAVTAATMSFATTYALGRAASYYFYHKGREEPVSNEAMQTVYKTAMTKSSAVSKEMLKDND